MAETIEQSFVTTFRTMVMHLAQQRKPRFATHTMQQWDVVGDRDTFEQLAATEGREITGERFTVRPLEDADHERRSNFKRDFEWSKGISSQDQLALLIDPTRDYARSAAYYVVRQKDRLVLEGALGTAYTGKNGGTPVVFNTAEYTTPGGQVVTAGGAMSETTFRLLRRIFDEHEEMLEDMEDGDMDAFCAALTPRSHDQLLSEVQTTSRDFYMDPIMGRMPLVNGRIPFFMGFRIRVTNRLNPFIVGAVHRNVFWHRTAIGSSVWRDMTMDVSRRNDLTGLPWQVVVNFSCNATRLRETATFAVDTTA